MTIFTKPEPRRPFRGIGEALGGGIQQGITQQIEQSAIDRLLKRVQGQQVDPLEAVLQSGLPAERQSQIARLFNERQKNQLLNQDKLEKVSQFGRSSKVAGDIFRRADEGELSINQAVGEVFDQVDDPKVMSEAIADLKSRRMDLRVRDRLEKSDFEVKENVKLINDITSEAREAKKVLKGLERQKELIQTGKTSDVKQFIGKQFPSMRRWLENPESTELRALALNDLKGAVSLFGGGTRFTDAKLRFVMDTISNPGATQEQQLAALEGFEDVMRSKLISEQALRKIREQNPNKNLKFIPGLSLKLNDFLDDIPDEIQPSLGIQQAQQISPEVAAEVLRLRQQGG